ncbi:hypothetical protein DXG03_003059 [Asterophora parasitica]|uniref:Uncharacterized protein n=1 Tax=Asterophora parasitica TaxID=117018 RepID=A0A9P7G876_9AGAR|nr:hypothetical protein DXG03_003059 [Asterophora parasitica]
MTRYKKNARACAPTPPAIKAVMSYPPGLSLPPPPAPSPIVSDEYRWPLPADEEDELVKLLAGISLVEEAMPYTPSPVKPCWLYQSPQAYIRDVVDAPAPDLPQISIVDISPKVSLPPLLAAIDVLPSPGPPVSATPYTLLDALLDVPYPRCIVIADATEPPKMLKRRKHLLRSERAYRIFQHGLLPKQS